MDNSGIFPLFSEFFLELFCIILWNGMQQIMGYAMGDTDSLQNSAATAEEKPVPFRIFYNYPAETLVKQRLPIPEADLSSRRDRGRQEEGIAQAGKAESGLVLWRVKKEKPVPGPGCPHVKQSKLLPVRPRIP